MDTKQEIFRMQALGVVGEQSANIGKQATKFLLEDYHPIVALAAIIPMIPTIRDFLERKMGQRTRPHFEAALQDAVKNDLANAIKHLTELTNMMADDARPEFEADMEKKNATK